VLFLSGFALLHRPRVATVVRACPGAEDDACAHADRDGDAAPDAARHDRAADAAGDDRAAHATRDDRAAHATCDDRAALR
jgi:hypothetical protein